MLKLSRLFTRPAPSEGARQLREHVDTARRLFSDASELSDRGRGAISAVPLYREAFRQLALARQLHRSPDDAEMSPMDAVKSLFDKSEDAARLFDQTPASWRETRALVRASKRASLRLEPFLRSELQWTRREVHWKRLALFLGFCAALIAVSSYVLKTPRNVALGKPVVASGTRFGTPTALTNGAVEWGTFGLHTNDGDAWALIDLGKFYGLVRATIFGRGDGHFEANLPLWIELSDDGTTFRRAASCIEPIFQARPCEASLKNERARYVRLHSTGIALTEVQIFGSP